MGEISDLYTLTEQLSTLGVQRGGVLVVHAAFSKVGPIAVGPQGLIAALQRALGPAGTLVMPSMTDDDDRLFDPRRTPCHGMGVLADTFWRMPAVMRSDNPHAFAAIGRWASEITAQHPVTMPHGLDSPIGRVYALAGQVLLLGVGHDANTSIHLAENLAGVRYRLPAHATVLEAGQPTRYDYGEIDHCCENFCLMDDWLDESGLQRRGLVGHAQARVIDSRAVVETALTRLRDHETVFLHSAAVGCSECDQARASVLE